MTYKEFLETLEELELDLDSVSEALDLEISDIESWEEEDEIPKSAEKWIKKEKVDFAELHNSNEDDGIDDDEEEDDLDDNGDDDDNDLDFDDEEEEK
jgi:ribonuclease E